MNNHFAFFQKFSIKSLKAWRPLFMKTLSVLSLLLIASCVPDAGGSKLKKLSGAQVYKDNKKGCGEKYFVFSSGNSCVESCQDVDGTHNGTNEEITELKKKTTADILKIMDNSKGICVDDVEVIKRPTNAFVIEPSTCTCRNGKSDVVNNCDTFCASKPINSNSIMYLDLTPSNEVILNDKLKNLHNWCQVQLDDGFEKPECMLRLWNESNEFYVPITTTANSNKATADISTVTEFNKSYIVSVVETKSKAQSGEYQLYRRPQSSTAPNLGPLKIANISQYTCLSYGGIINSSGQFVISSEARIFYYYPASELPTAVPPYEAGKPRNVVCHDTLKAPANANDSIAYPRLENIPIQFTMWDKKDSRFTTTESGSSKLVIDKAIEDKFFEATNGKQTANLSLFTSVTYPNGPRMGTNRTDIPMGFMMIPFVENGVATCPKQSDFDGNNILYNVLAEFIPETEALYIAEKEAELVTLNGTSQTIYGNMFITESKVVPVAFYYENGIKIKAKASDFSGKTIHFYWPIDNTLPDPLMENGRKLYTIKSPDMLNGNVPTGVPSSVKPQDHRIGCVPRSF